MKKTRTHVGKFLAKLRVDHNETMAQMAVRLGYSAMYLSNVEIGIRNVTKELPERIRAHYELNEDQNKELDEAVFLSPRNKIEVYKIIDIITFLQSTATSDDYRYSQALQDLSHIIRKEVKK